jgi:hypothetical protein
MKTLILLLVSLCVGTLSQSFAADAPPPSPQAVPAQPVSAAPVAGTLSTVSTPAASAAKTEDPAAVRFAAQTKRLRAMGYKPEVHNGVTLFCRYETRLGSRFEVPNCQEGDIIEKEAQDSKDVMQKVQRQNPMTSH